MSREIDALNRKRINIILSGQRALLGTITSKLRIVETVWDEIKITLYFIYDGPFSKENEDQSKLVARIIQQDFMNYTVEAICLRIDYPNDFPARIGKNCTLLYARKE